MATVRFSFRCTFGVAFGVTGFALELFPRVFLGFSIPVSVSTGLKLVYYAIVELVVVVVLLLLGGVAVTFLEIPPPPPQVLFLISVGFLINLLICWVASFVGKCYCTSVPRESGAGGLIFATVGLEAIYALGVLFAFLSGFFWMMPQGPAFQPNAVFQQAQFIGIFRLVNLLTGVAAYFCFLSFNSKLGRYMQRHDVRRFAITVIITNVLCIIAYFGATFVLVGAVINGFGNNLAAFQFFGWFGIALLIMMLIVICMYTSLLRTAFRAVDDYCREKR